LFEGPALTGNDKGMNLLSASDLITVTSERALLKVTLNRPEKANALTREMLPRVFRT